jgi:hypothetical protein
MATSSAKDGIRLQSTAPHSTFVGSLKCHLGVEGLEMCRYVWQKLNSQTIKGF